MKIYLASNVTGMIKKRFIMTSSSKLYKVIIV